MKKRDTLIFIICWAVMVTITMMLIQSQMYTKCDRITQAPIKTCIIYDKGGHF